jgi:signal transduction histidine kinase
VNSSVPIQSAIAFFAAGANALAAGVLLLFIPWHRQVRWYAGFTLAQVAWLISLGADLARTDPTHTQWTSALGALSLLLPATFLAFGLVADRDARLSRLAIVFLAYLLLLPAAASNLPWLRSLTNVGGHVIGWGVGSWLLWRSRRSSAKIFGSPRDRRASDWLLRTVLSIPIFVAVAIILGLRDAFVWIMPPALVILQMLIFYGLLRHEFYQVEIKVSRSGELAAAAAEQERLAVLGELSATVAHEVRNPLTGIRSLAQRLAHDEVDDTKRRRYAEVIVTEIDRVERIVSDLLALARRSPVPDARAERVELDALFADVELLAAPRAERASVALRVDGGGVAVDAPREALTQVLLNLVINAIAASPVAGEVTVDATAVPNGVEIAVCDQGPGVPVEMRTKIFEAFYTGSGGAGLGLALVRRVSDSQGWTVRVTEAGRRGARFEVVIPSGRVARPLDASGSNASRPSPAVGVGLAAEDERDVRPSR